MDQQVGSVKKSIDKIYIQEFPSKNSSFTKFRGSSNSSMNNSIKSQMSLQFQNNVHLLRGLSGSDTCEKRQHLSNSMKSEVLPGQSHDIMIGSSQIIQDKRSSRLLDSHGLDEDQILSNDIQITHQCQCMLLNKSQYCPQSCDCYQKTQQCSQDNCCPRCYASKIQRLPLLLRIQSNYKTTQEKPTHSREQNLTRKLTQQSEEIEQFVVAKKKPPRQFRKQRCECRNSKCYNKYCVCFTAGNKCTINCMCQNCLNCEQLVGSQTNSTKKILNKQQIYTQNSNNGFFPAEMEFQPVKF